MSTIRDNIEALVTRYHRANSAGSVKVANALVPELVSLILEYIDEQNGKPTQTTDATIVAAAANPENIVTPIDELKALNEEDQLAYIEANYRFHGIVNNGAKYLGDEARVTHFVNLLAARAKPAAVCAPCAVNETGGSAITAALEPVAAAAPTASKKAPAKKPAAKKPAAKKPAPKKVA